MKFILPTTIEVGPMTVAVEVGEVSDNDWGEFLYEKAQILINARASGDLLTETFMHEVVEAINTMYELRLPHAKIQILGAALAQVLKSARSSSQR